MGKKNGGETDGHCPETDTRVRKRTCSSSFHIKNGGSQRAQVDNGNLLDRCETAQTMTLGRAGGKKKSYGDGIFHATWRLVAILLVSVAKSPYVVYSFGSMMFRSRWASYLYILFPPSLLCCSFRLKPPPAKRRAHVDRRRLFRSPPPESEDIEDVAELKRWARRKTTSAISSAQTGHTSYSATVWWI